MAELNELTINGSNYTFEDDVARGLATTEASRAQAVEQSLQTAINNKVDKVTGKGLSTNDYTNDEKAKLAGLNNYDDTQVRQLIAQTNANFANYYTKAESYSATEVDTLLRTQRQGQFVPVNTLPTPSADTMFKIYLVPSTNSETQNVKDEFVTLENNGTYSWEQMGSTAVDLSGYSTTVEMNAAIANALASYYTKSEIDTALGTKQNIINDLSDIRSGAQAGSTAVQPSTLNSVVKNTVAESGVYDVSANNDNTKFESLSALLGSANLNTLIPTDIRKGGMSIKFVQSSDNKYIQFRYMSSSTAVADFTNVANWQGVDDEPTDGSDNLVKSGDVFTLNNLVECTTNTKLIKFIRGFYIKTKEEIGSIVNLTPIQNSALSYSIVDVSLGDIITLNAKGWSDGRLWAFVDSSNALINVSSDTLTADSLRITVPNNAVKLILNSYTNELKGCFFGSDYNYLDSKFKDVRDSLFNTNLELDKFESDISDLVSTKLNINKLSGYYIGDNGELVSSSSSQYASDLIDVSSYKVLLITARANFGHYIYAFYDENQNFIKDKSEQANPGSAYTQIVNKVVYLSSDIKYLRVAQVEVAEPLSIVEVGNFHVKGLNELTSKVNSVTSSETYTNDYIISGITWESGYVNQGGTETESTSYSHTDKIPVIEGDIIYGINNVSGARLNFRFVTAYDSSDTPIYSKGGTNVSGNPGYVVPEGISNIILTCSGTVPKVWTIHIVRNSTIPILSAVNNTDRLFKKKWCVCGDSFSYGGQANMPVFDEGKYKGFRKSYPYFIGNRTHIDIVDFSNNGRTLAYPADGTFSNSLTNPSAECYYQNIPADVDYITIYLGINDSHHAPGSSGGDGESNTGEIPIGTINDETTSTFGGAWNVVLTWLITNRPNAHIGILVSNGVDNVSYRNLTIDIAKKYGIAYIDLNGDERTPAMLRTVNPDISSAVKTALINKWAVDPSTNTHPNIDAHEYESYFIEDFLRSI